MFCRQLNQATNNNIKNKGPHAISTILKSNQQIYSIFTWIGKTNNQTTSSTSNLYHPSSAQSDLLARRRTTLSRATARTSVDALSRETHCASPNSHSFFFSDLPISATKATISPQQKLEQLACEDSVVLLLSTLRAVP